MEEALFLQHKGDHPKKLKLITANDDSPQAFSIRQYKQEIAEKYQGDWERFFIEWRTEQNKNHSQVIEQLKENEKIANLKAQEVLEQYENFYHQHLKIQNQVEVLHQQALQNQQEKQEKEARKLKRKQANKQQLRQTVTPKEFKFILSLVKGVYGVKERRRFALVLLYITGLRVSNLLNLSVAQVKQLITKGKNHISLIKEGDQRFHLRLGAKGKQLLSVFLNKFVVISKGKESQKPLFTSHKDKDRVIAR